MSRRVSMRRSSIIGVNLTPSKKTWLENAKKRKIIVGVDKRNCLKKTPDGLFDDPEDFILNARLIYAEEDTKSVVLSDSEEEYYSEIEEVAASEEELIDEAMDEPIEEHEQSMMALDEEYEELAPEPSPMASPVSVASKVKSSLATPITVRSADLDSPRSGRTEVTTLTRHSSPLVADHSLAKKLDFDGSVAAEDEYEPIEHDVDVDAQLMSDNESDKENEVNKPQAKAKRPRAAPKKKTKEVSDKYVVEELQSPPNKTPNARRSRRRRLQPLAYWKNERVVYGRRESCAFPTYVGYVRRPVEEDPNAFQFSPDKKEDSY